MCDAEVPKFTVVLYCINFPFIRNNLGFMIARANSKARAGDYFLIKEETDETPVGATEKSWLIVISAD